MSRTRNEIVTEIYELGRQGTPTYSDFQRLWHELNDSFEGKSLKDWQKADLLSVLAAIAQPEWLDSAPLRSGESPRKTA